MSSEGPNAGEGVFCGVDVGAASTKVVLMDVDGKMLGSHVRKSGVDYQIAACDCLEKALVMAGLKPDAVNGTIATGYGRRNVEFAGDAKTEILCHSAGCYFYFPKAITIVDIGGQDTKVIRIDADGRAGVDVAGTAGGANAADGRPWQDNDETQGRTSRLRLVLGTLGGSDLVGVYKGV